MGFVEKFIFWIIPLVVLIILAIMYFGEGSMFESIKDMVDKLVGVSGISIGANQLSGEKPQLPPEHQQAADNLKKAFNGFEGKKDCFFHYGPFNDLKGVSINITVSGDKNYLNIYGGAGGTQLIESNEVKLKPCVIAGESGGKIVAEEFLKKFVNGNNSITKNYYSPATKIQFAKNNAVSYQLHGSALDSSNLEDNGWLFVANENRVCFFPTNLVRDATSSGLDNDFFVEINRISITRMIKEGKLTVCNESVKAEKVISDCVDYDNQDDCTNDIKNLNLKNNIGYCKWEENKCIFKTYPIGAKE